MLNKNDFIIIIVYYFIQYDEDLFEILNDEKSFQICFTGDTINEGDFSFTNGDKPFKLLPARLSWTKSPITSSTRAVSNTFSMVSFDIKLTI